MRDKHKLIKTSRVSLCSTLPYIVFSWFTNPITCFVSEIGLGSQFTMLIFVITSFESISYLLSGEALDEYNSTQSIPSPWSIDIAQPKPFHMQTTTETIPHTDILMTCQACGGVGSKRCNVCSAVGWVSSISHLLCVLV